MFPRLRGFIIYIVQGGGELVYVTSGVDFSHQQSCMQFKLHIDKMIQGVNSRPFGIYTRSVGVKLQVLLNRYMAAMP